MDKWRQARILKKSAEKYLRAHGLLRVVNVDGIYPGDCWMIRIYVQSEKDSRRLWSIAPGIQKRLERTIVAANLCRMDLVVVIRNIRD